MKKKALIVYYSQSGQLEEIIDSVVAPLVEDFELTYEKLKPVPDYPFPWTGMSFFQAFPESVQEIPCELEAFSFDPNEDFDLIILAYQPWYLSPSIPMTSFLQSAAAARVLKGKKVITVSACRNMWIMAQERVKEMINDAGGSLVGNVVFSDKHHNLISVITIVHWMTKGTKKGRGLFGKIFPAAGVTDSDIKEAGKFGTVMRDAFRNDQINGLQDMLLDIGAVRISQVLMTIEKRGRMMFDPWSKFVLKKGGAGASSREVRLKMFRAYLFTVIYLVSPVGGAVIWLIHKLNRKKARLLANKYSGVK